MLEARLVAAVTFAKISFDFLDLRKEEKIEFGGKIT